MNRIKGILLALLLIAVSVLSLGCSSNEIDPSTLTKLSFKSTSTYEYLKTLDGQNVTINGYMATSSPVDGSFMFLMNMPYQSCPFCVPNTSQLSNTIEVYPHSGERFSYTTQAIKVTGKLQVAPTKDDFFTDMYGYEFNFKIVDATYTILQSSEMSEELAMWQSISNSDVINEIYSMYDYVNFVCKWNTYYVNNYVDQSGVEHKGFFLYPQDALSYIEKDGAQWNYGYVEGYFDKLIAKIRKVDENAFETLVQNVEKAKALSDKALNELKSENYTSNYQYVEKFDTFDYIYTINKAEELNAEMDKLFLEFSNWLSSWEM
ncbi:MAG: hypothetical protein IJW54_06920 [Clostridia bacterium]|nr:hypothetical protein [Clostridia bacterium]